MPAAAMLVGSGGGNGDRELVPPLNGDSGLRLDLCGGAEELLRGVLVVRLDAEGWWGWCGECGGGFAADAAAAATANGENNFDKLLIKGWCGEGGVKESAEKLWCRCGISGPCPGV